ncbi:MAG TPA: hypothetical protein VGB97_04895 [Candidatus Paceibacterota bacterium]
MEPFTIRRARRDDLDALALLEQKSWTRRGTPVLSKTDLAHWYAEGSPFFLVAEQGAAICGYYFGRQVHFSPDEAADFLDRGKLTDKGFSVHAHDLFGDSVYGINVTATVPGAGIALNRAVHELLEEMRMKYFLGYTRLSSFGSFLRRLPNEANEREDDLALWYACESARLLGMRVWPQAPEHPALGLPALRRPDPVLAFHVRDTRLGLFAIVRDYMTDPASRNYGAFIVSEYPHR